MPKAVVEGQTPAVAFQGRERLAAAWAVQIAPKLHSTTRETLARVTETRDYIEALPRRGYRFLMPGASSVNPIFLIGPSSLFV